GVGGTGLALFLWSSLSFKPNTLNIHDQQRINRRWSLLIVGVFALFVGFLGFGVDVFFFKMSVPWLGLNVVDQASRFAYGTRAYWDAVGDAGRPGVPYATVGAIGFSLLMAWYNFQNAAKMVLAASGARAPKLDDPKEAQFVNVVKEM